MTLQDTINRQKSKTKKLFQLAYKKITLSKREVGNFKMSVHFDIMNSHLIIY